METNVPKIVGFRPGCGKWYIIARSSKMVDFDPGLLHRKGHQDQDD